MRLLLAPLILLLAALSFPALDAARRAHAYGWLAPEMAEHWARLWRERTQHAAKNVLSEWVRLDPQRAGKLLAFLLCVAIFFIMVLMLQK